MDEEAIPERDPSYQLPEDDQGTTNVRIKWTFADRVHWLVLVSLRPALKSLEK